MCRSVLPFAWDTNCVYFVYEVDTMKIQSCAGNNNDKIVVAVIIIVIIIIIRGLIQGINPGWVIGRNFLLLN